MALDEGAFGSLAVHHGDGAAAAVSLTYSHERYWTGGRETVTRMIMKLMPNAARGSYDIHTGTLARRIQFRCEKNRAPL